MKNEYKIVRTKEAVVSGKFPSIGISQGKLTLAKSEIEQERKTWTVQVDKTVSIWGVNKKKLEFAINMSIIPAFGQIAINQLKLLQLNNNTLPNFKNVKRKDLIIDMEKNINIIRLIQYAYKNGKLWM